VPAASRCCASPSAATALVAALGMMSTIVVCHCQQLQQEEKEMAGFTILPLQLL